MAEEKKYEITISDLVAYIGVATLEILPEDATPEVVDMYNTVAAHIALRLTKHLDGTDPLPEDEIIYAKKIGCFVNGLGMVCEKIFEAATEE